VAGRIIELLRLPGRSSGFGEALTLPLQVRDAIASSNVLCSYWKPVLGGEEGRLLAHDLLSSHCEPIVTPEKAERCWQI